ncbi:synaptic vesicle 2-related protein-like isoform X2 [Tachypleus tridentatus]|uniref:synaptic vesicle 2-related protein-like isoform X2 n=1 Tax=Tachypleus tridentatus TaxID=6853 RepID=UPI003FD27C93
MMVDALWKSNDDKVRLVSKTENENYTNSTGGPELIATASYTVEDAVNASGFGRFQWKLTFLSSFAWMAEACEVMILSLLGRLLSCYWLITFSQVALLTSFVFLSMAVGAPIIGKLGDIYGRKNVVVGSTCMILIFGVLSATSTSIGWMIGFRGLMGFFVHGMNIIMVLYMEFLPINRRGQGTMLLAVYPESARHMLINGKVKEAEKILSEMSETNKKSLPLGTLVLPPTGLEKGSIINLIKEQKKLFIILSYVWVSLTFTYYGMTLLSPEVILHGGLPLNANQPEETAVQKRIANTSLSYGYMLCKPFTMTEYLNLLWITAAELPGVFLSWFLVEKFSRRRLIFVFFLVYLVSILLLLVDNLPSAVSLISLFVGRSFIAGCFQICVVYTLEAYPTIYRATGYGIYTGLGRIGAIITPFIAQVLMNIHPKLTCGIYAMVAFVSAMSSLALPFDTKGQELADH